MRRRALRGLTEEPGEAAFYGPKIDFVAGTSSDANGNWARFSGLQPARAFRFDLQGSDGEMHRPVMIHRAPFGSMERFVSVLIEHFAGMFPTWLSPTRSTCYSREARRLRGRTGRRRCEPASVCR